MLADGPWSTCVAPEEQKETSGKVRMVKIALVRARASLAALLRAHVEVVVDELWVPKDEKGGRRGGAAGEPEAEGRRRLPEPQPVARVRLDEWSRG